MLVRAGLARLGCLPSWRCLSSVPRIGELRTVRQVVDAHAQHHKQYRPNDLGASWNTLGKLVRRQSEKQVLRAAPRTLQPLAVSRECEAPCEAPAHRMGGPAAAGADASRSNRPAAARCKSFEADTANAPRPLLCAGVRSDRLRWKMCCAPSGTSVAPRAGGVASKPRDLEPNVPG